MSFKMDFKLPLKFLGIQCGILFCFGVCFAQLGTTTQEDHFKHLNQDDQNIVVSDDIVPENNGENASKSDSAMRQGTYSVVNTGDTEEISTFYTKEQEKVSAYYETTNYIKNIVNYVLGFLGIIALVFLIYHGYQYVFGTTEDAIKEAGKQMKKTGIAIGGIALSWFLVSFIIYAIRLIVA